MTWALNSGNETPVATLKRDLQDVGYFDVDKIHDTIVSNVWKFYSRPHVSEYEYLMDEFSPSTLLLIMGFLTCAILSAILG